MELSEIKTSILTPAFIDSSEKLFWLNQTVQSVLNQTRKEWEMVIVDDGSPIPVKNIWNDDRILVFRLSTNKGVSIARNTAAALSKGYFILPLDADDMLHVDALEILFNNWEPNKFVYGNVDLYIPSNDKWTIGSTIKLPHFNCRLIINPKAAAPVSCLHTRETWKKSGGWKSELTNGLEDVEYWIDVIRSSCTLGKKIDHSTLLYRKHENSRTKRMRNNSAEKSMQELIFKRHADIYGGKDMGCGCGGSKPSTPVGRPMTRDEQIAATSALMAAAAEQGQLWEVQYIGPRSGNFGVVGNVTRQSYKIGGTGSVFVVHESDVKRFTQMGRREPEFVVMGKYNSEEVKTDEIKDEKFSPQPIEIDENPIQVLQSEPVDDSEIMLTELPGKKNAIQNLIDDGWTIEKLSEAKVGDLIHVKGVAKRTETLILKAAKEIHYRDKPPENVV